jgi:hypothetical protein
MPLWQNLIFFFEKYIQKNLMKTWLPYRVYSNLKAENLRYQIFFFNYLILNID